MEEEKRMKKSYAPHYPPIMTSNGIITNNGKKARHLHTVLVRCLYKNNNTITREQKGIYFDWESCSPRRVENYRVLSTAQIPGGQFRERRFRKRRQKLASTSPNTCSSND